MLVRDSGLNPTAGKKLNKQQQTNNEFSYDLLCESDNLVACWVEPPVTCSFNTKKGVQIPSILFFYNTINYIPHVVLFILMIYLFCN